MGIESFLDTNVGGLAAGGVLGGVEALLGQSEEEAERKRRQEEADKRREMERMAMAQQQFQNNFGNTVSLAQQVQSQFGGQGGGGFV